MAGYVLRLAARCAGATEQDMIAASPTVDANANNIEGDQTCAAIPISCLKV
jgi:hypothetical protein